MDLPTSWNLDDKSIYLSVDSSRLRVNYEGLGENEEDVATTSNDMGDKLLKNKLIKAFNMCINTMNIYTLEDLENLLKVKQDTAALKFRGKFNIIMGSYEDAIIDLTKLIVIEPNNKFALRYRAEAYYLMKKYKESFNDLKKLLKIEANDEWASKLMAKIIENNKRGHLPSTDTSPPAQRKSIESSPFNTMEHTITQLLVTTKSLLEALTAWSYGRVTEQQVSDIYVKLTIELNHVVQLFGQAGMDTSNMVNIPQDLKVCLENALCEEASPSSLDNHLPKIKDIIVTLLQALKTKQSIYRQSQKNYENNNNNCPQPTSSVNGAQSIFSMNQNPSSPSSNKPGHLPSTDTSPPAQRKSIESFPFNTLEHTITQLLVATKSLLEALTAWSNGRVTEQQVSDIYVKLAIELNHVVQFFGKAGMDTSNMVNIPQDLKVCLENTLCEEASPSSLDHHLPKIKDIIVTLLQALKTKQSIYRQSQKNYENNNNNCPQPASSVNGAQSIFSMDQNPSSPSNNRPGHLPSTDTSNNSDSNPHGIEVEKDEHKAFIYYQQSAEMGHAEGTLQVGYCYDEGIGVEKDER
ncbi:AIP3-domain-containing protein [Gigaspora margarita]|uniref:AIP3-domain-containing protein n=1 Tax=Gigaspora margarita TaxID=4874 RepID=A0A8H4AWL7_GIGMA|nr:AIP3-domain-containing protein [Gigaspora margarita]KAF0539810.1 AIP3-domain-containing protein [Gigaspora margarita]